MSSASHFRGSELARAHHNPKIGPVQKARVGGPFPSAATVKLDGSFHRVSKSNETMGLPLSPPRNYFSVPPFLPPFLPPLSSSLVHLSLPPSIHSVWLSPQVAVVVAVVSTLPPLLP